VVRVVVLGVVFLVTVVFREPDWVVREPAPVPLTSVVVFVVWRISENSKQSTVRGLATFPSPELCAGPSVTSPAVAFRQIHPPSRDSVRKNF
jgi:hypothetical protein